MADIISLLRPTARLKRTRFQYEANLLWVFVPGACFYATLTYLATTLGLAAAGRAMLVIQLFVAVVGAVLFAIPIIWTQTRLRRSARETQEDRNRFAAEAIRTGGAGVDGEFALYLRPFIVDGQVKHQTRFYDNEFLARLADDNFENVLTQAVDRRHPVVALGRRADTLGPGMADAGGDDWQDMVLALMRAASLIMIVPIAQPSTLWEIKQLHLRDHLHKTVFVVPRQRRQTVAPGKTLVRQSLEDLYGESHERFKREEIPMPKMGPMGGIYWLHHEQRGEKLWRYRAFRRPRDMTFRLMRKVIFDVRTSPLTDKDVFSRNFDHLPGT